MLSNDTGTAGDTLTAALDQGPSHGTLTLHANGTFTYTPGTGFSGSDSFTYTPKDGAFTGTPTTVTISVVDTAPVGHADTYTTPGNATLTVAAKGVLANDSDAEHDKLTAALSAGPSNGGLTLNADGSFSYTPNAGFVGTDSFSYMANDGILSSASTLVTLKVMSDMIGGISMLHGLAALDADPATKVIVLISKPPSEKVAAHVLAAARASAKPVVVIFLGADPASISGNGVHGALHLAQAADIAVALAKGQTASAQAITLGNETKRSLTGLARAMSPTQRYVRGIFSGGTFCFEAQLVHAAAGITAFSNTPTVGNERLTRSATSEQNTIIDMGDDEFTQGRPHPMIDPSQRDARIRQEADDPTTAVVLFDVVLGYGAAADPIAGLLGAIGSARSKAKASGRTLAFIGYVCGTDQDPQNRADIVAKLNSAGVLVASSNAEAAAWSVAIIAERNGARS